MAIMGTSTNKRGRPKRPTLGSPRRVITVGINLNAGGEIGGSGHCSISMAKVADNRDKAWLNVNDSIIRAALRVYSHYEGMPLTDILWDSFQYYTTPQNKRNLGEYLTDMREQVEMVRARRAQKGYVIKNPTDLRDEYLWMLEKESHVFSQWNADFSIPVAESSTQDAILVFKASLMVIAHFEGVPYSTLIRASLLSRPAKGVHPVQGDVTEILATYLQKCETVHKRNGYEDNAAGTILTASVVIKDFDYGN